MKLKNLRKILIEKLQDANNTSPHADVDLCLITLLGVTKGEIILGDREIKAEEENGVNKAVERIAKGEPVQYVTGRCEFMSLELMVDKSTLIPRADTEILVERVMDFCENKDKIRILEIGCGSGCIAVSLACYLKEAKIFALDISADALEIAKKNAKKMGVEDKIEFLKWDIMQGFPHIEDGVDVVVSNPPYIPSKEIDTLEQKVKAFEPRTALDGGADGLDFYRKISRTAVLNNEGMIAFEVGYNQAEEVKEILCSCGYERVETVKDLSGINRVVCGIMV